MEGARGEGGKRGKGRETHLRGDGRERDIRFLDGTFVIFSSSSKAKEKKTSQRYQCVSEGCWGSWRVGDNGVGARGGGEEEEEEGGSVGRTKEGVCARWWFGVGRGERLSHKEDGD